MLGYTVNCSLLCQAASNLSITQSFTPSAPHRTGEDAIEAMMTKSVTQLLAWFQVTLFFLIAVAASSPVSCDMDSAKTDGAICSKLHEMFTFARCGHLNQQ